jgi:hypothetical protein
MNWTIEAALDHIRANGFIFQIGQLPATTTRRLDRMARQGTLVKQQAYWPNWTSGISRKTGWMAV